VVALRVAALKFSDLVFFAIHPEFSIGTSGSRILLPEWFFNPAFPSETDLKKKKIGV